MAAEGDFEPLADAGLIAVKDIDLGDRLRPVDETWAEALGKVMLQDGQRTPIEVCRSAESPGRYTLVSGAHRLRGAQKVGLAYLKAMVILADASERRIAEISENLFRRDLDPIDRAAFIAELVTHQKVRMGIDPAKDGRAASIDARWKKAVKDEAVDTTVTMTVVYGWTEKVAAAIGVSPATVERSLTLHRRLNPNVVAGLRARGHPILQNASQLRTLAKLEPVEQSKVASWLLHTDMQFGAPAKTLAEAIGRLSNRAAPDAEAKRLSTFLDTFARMGLTEKKAALAMLAPQLPKGITLTGLGESQ